MHQIYEGVLVYFDKNLILMIFFLFQLSTGFEMDASFVLSRRFNKVDLLVDGHLYSKVCRTNRSTFWRCRQARSNAYKCKCRAVTRRVNGMQRVKLSQSSGNHNHPAVAKAAIERMQFVYYMEE